MPEPVEFLEGRPPDRGFNEGEPVGMDVGPPAQLDAREAAKEADGSQERAGSKGWQSPHVNEATLPRGGVMRFAGS